MGNKISIASVITILVFGFVLIGWSGNAGAESAAELKAQIKVMQKQMQQMQSTMQAMQKKIDELEGTTAAAKAPSGAAGPSVWSKYNMRLYGKVKMDVNYDTAQFNKYNDFVGAVAAGEDHKNDSTNFNPRDTRFGFEASHNVYKDWLAKGRFEIDFYGDNNGDNLIPRMRLAYIDLSNKSGTDLRIGQDWIPVATLNPSTIDFGILTAAGNLWWRVPQITLRQKFGCIEVMGSLMKHRRTDTANEDRMPWMLGRLALNGGILGDGNLLAVGGGYRHADYGTNTSENTDRWLVVGEAKYGIGPVLMKGEIWTGEGLGRNFLRYDLDMANDGSPASAYGGWFDLTYKLNFKTSFTAGYGFDNPDNDDIGPLTKGDDRRFTKNEIYFLNAWYSLSKPLKVGAEWMHLETERHQEINTGNRYTVSMQYVF